MRVGVHRHSEARVAHRDLQRLQVHVGRNHERGERVPEGVNVNPADAGSAQGRQQSAVEEIRRVLDPARPCREHQVKIAFGRG